MKNSKIVFGILALCLIAAFLIPFLLFREKDSVDPPSASTRETKESLEEKQTKPTVADLGSDEDPLNPTSPFIPAEQEAMTIVQVEKDPKEVIDRTVLYDESHPEFLQDERYGDTTFLSSEGSVYRNDKTISLRVQNIAKPTATHVFTFGYITGKCNRFLYLNPQYESLGAEARPMHFYFITPAPGTVTTVAEPPAIETVEYPTYTVGRATESRVKAAYTSPSAPGAIWFTAAPLDGPQYLDCLVMEYSGDIVAVLRLTIEKAADGTYSLTRVEDKNLLKNGGQTPGGTWSDPKHLVFLLDNVNEVVRDNYKLMSSLYNPGYDMRNEDITLTLDDLIITYCDQTTGMYYTEFVPYQQNRKRTYHYLDQGYPILAVTARIWDDTYTLYFQVWAAPDNIDMPNGHYNYIGRDYTSIMRMEDLLNAGYGNEFVE